jgi:hypothetical protein
MSLLDKYRKRYGPAYASADNTEAIAIVVVIVGVGGGTLIGLWGLSTKLGAGGLAAGAIVAGCAFVIYTALNIAAACLRAFLDQAVHSSPLSTADKETLVFSNNDDSKSSESRIW